MDFCASCIRFAVMPEKLLDEMTIKLGLDQKRRLVALAEADGLTASELVRRLIEAHLDERERHFRALSLPSSARAGQHPRSDSMGGGNSARARHPGPARRLWELLLARPLGEGFLARDIVAQYPEFNVGTFPLKGVGRAIGHLIRQGGVEVAERVRLPGETWITCVYRRRADHLSAPVRREPAPAQPSDRREIRFLDTWKPFRDGDPRKARWLGYSSSLAGIE